MDTVVLRIENPESAGGPYRVALISLPGNEVLATGSFASDLAPAGISPLFTEERIKQILADPPSENKELAEIGAQLYALVAPGKINDELKPSGAERRVLLDVQPADLRSLPWELMVRDGVQLMCVEHKPLCRGAAGDLLPDHDWPLRVLIVDGGEGLNENVVQAGAEIREIVRSISTSRFEADIDLLVLKRPTRWEILDAFKKWEGEPQRPHQGFRPHVLHFIGHGNTAGSQAYLLLHDAAGNFTRWTAAEIKTDFSGPNKPRLAVLNACRSTEEAPNGLWSVSDAFLGAEIPAVIGMQANISGAHARLFAAGLYGALADGKPLDQAVVAGRKRIWENVENSSLRPEWATPTLQVSTNPESIVTIGRHIDAATRGRVGQIGEFGTVRRLVDRQDKRSRAWGRLATDLLKVVVVRGGPEVGKTEFVRLLMERCALCKHQIRYVNMAGVRGADALAVLRRIMEGDGEAIDEDALTAPLPAAAFQEFRDVVKAVLGAPLSESSRLLDILDIDRKRLFKAFQDGLEKSVVTPPLVIVLDHLKEVDDEQFRSFLLPHLVTWCANRQDRNIMLVLLLRTDEYEDFALDKIQGKFMRVDIDGFPGDEWANLAWEFVWRNLQPVNAAAETDAQKVISNIIDALTLQVNWPPTALQNLKAFAVLSGHWSQR